MNSNGIAEWVYFFGEGHPADGAQPPAASSCWGDTDIVGASRPVPLQKALHNPEPRHRRKLVREDLDVRSALADEIDRCITSIDGVTVSPSGFGDADAYWVNGKEVAHFDDATTVDLRLTRSLISERRHEFKADPRVVLRRSTSDWLEIRIGDAQDLEWFRGLVELAVAAHRAPAGTPPIPPPSGAALERRRRFH